VSAEQQKKAAAEASLELVKSGMKLGLGTGSTAAFLIDALAAKAKAGLDVECFPTSRQTAEHAKRVGLKLGNFHDHPILDLTIDGTDEFDSDFQLIKGGGGALLFEKIIATSSRKMVVIADQSKQVKKLGKFPLPVEVVSMGVKATGFKVNECFRTFGMEPKMVLRMKDGKPFQTDAGNLIIDCAAGEIKSPLQLEYMLNGVPGVVNNGLFIGICSKIYMGTDGGVTVLNRPPAKA
jgi:ribose 5-phosphate isomerase A